MPIYEYLCDECGKRSSTLLPRFSSPDPACPHCGNVDQAKVQENLTNTFASLGLSEAAAKFAASGRD